MQRRARRLSDGTSAWPLRSLCALGAMLLVLGAAAAQEGADENAWQPRFQNPIVAESWDGERPLNVLEPLPFNDTGIVAQVGHQEPLPRPEGPPEPIPSDDANLLQPVPNQFLVTPSCATCGGCDRCAGCNLCEPCTANTRLGRFGCALVDAVCCPDPCYEPRWTGIANAAFWV